MASHSPRRSRAFFVTSSLVLSVAYFSVAIGTWLITNGAIETTADSVNSTCTPPSQITENFNSYSGRTAVTNISGWSGQSLGAAPKPNNANGSSGTDLKYWYSYSHETFPGPNLYDGGPGAVVFQTPNVSGDPMSITSPALHIGGQYQVSRPIRTGKTGEISFKFEGGLFASLAQYSGPWTISITGENGAAIRLRHRPSYDSTGYGGYRIQTSHLERFDALTGDFVSIPVTISSVGTIAAPKQIKIVWSDPTYRLFIDGTETPNSPFIYRTDEGSGRMKTFSAQATMGSIPAGTNQNENPPRNAFGYLILDDLSYPVGVGVPCISSVAPTTAAPGAAATLTGINLIADNAVVNGITGGAVPLTGSATSATFTVPASTTPGTYNIYVTNALGQSGTVPLTIAIDKASVSGVVFDDLDGDGTVGEGETKRAGQSIKLSRDEAPYTAITTATTTSNGAYAFNDLAAGRYRITYEIPAGYVRTTDNSRPFDLGPSITHNFGIRKTATTLSGTGLICSTDEQRRQMTEDFELFADGQAKDFGWFITAGGNTSATVKKDQGKSGNGLVLTDTNSANLSDAFVQISKPIPGTEAGSVAFDLKPTVANGAFTLSLASEKGETIVLGIKGDSVLYKQPTNADAQAIVSLGAIKLNEFNRIGVAWTKDTVEVTINGTKFSKEVLKYNVPANAGPIINVALATGSGDAGVGEAGSFVVDNLELPGCGNVLTLSVSPKTGNVPLEVTAVAGLPFKNLLNEPFAIGTDVDSAPTDLVTSRNKDTGALALSDIPTTSGACTTKSWLYDLDQNKVNQLLWKRAIPENATVEAKISWATPDTSARKGALLGGIGFIDKDSLFHQWVGIRDESTAEGKFGVVAASVRDGQKQTIDCAATTINYPEVTSVLPKGDTAFTPTRETFVSSQGTALLKLVRRGNKVKVFVDNEFVKEQTTAGDVAGLALGVAGLKDAEFGTLTLESLKLTNDAVGWDFGDKIQGRCIAGEKCEMPQTQGDTGTTVKHTYTTAGKFVVTVTNGGEEARSDAQSASTSVDVTPPPTGGGNPPTTPPDTRPTDNSQNGPPPGQANAPATLVSTGGNLYVNLGVALLLSIGTAYVLLRRRHPTDY